MKIALIGYGKMGKAIEEVALQHGHEILLKTNSSNVLDLNIDILKTCDVAIEFSAPHLAFKNVSTCLLHKVPTVCGTTAWLNQLQDAKDLCIAEHTAFLYASNFSVGVNIFFELNKKLAHFMAKHPSYAVSMQEIHHTAKLDAPSGTAVTLAEDIIEHIPNKTKWVNTATNAEHEIGIISKRIDPAPGTHSITYSSAIDDIEIIHTAHNRVGFATGAVIAAEFIVNKKGVYSMKDVLGI